MLGSLLFARIRVPLGPIVAVKAGSSSVGQIPSGSPSERVVGCII